MKLLDLLKVINELKKDVSLDYKINRCFEELRESSEELAFDFEIKGDEEMEMATKDIFDTIPYAREERAHIFNVLDMIESLIILNIKALPSQFTNKILDEYKGQALYLIDEALRELAKSIRHRAKRLAPDVISKRAMRKAEREKQRKKRKIIESLKESMR